MSDPRPATDPRWADMRTPEEQNPDDLLKEARNAARAVEALWRGYRDAKAGEAALKALRRYMELDALVTQGRIELPREWAEGSS